MSGPRLGYELWLRQHLAGGPRCLAQKDVASGKGVKAAPVATPAKRAVAVDDHVAELTAKAVRPAPDFAVQHDRPAGAEVELELHEVRLALRGAPGHFIKRAAMAFVVDMDQAAQAVMEKLANPHTVPGGQDRAEKDGPIARHRARDGQAKPGKFGYGDSPVGAITVQDRGNDIGSVGRGVAFRQVDMILAEHMAGRVAKRDVDLYQAQKHPGADAETGGSGRASGWGGLGRSACGRHPELRRSAGGL
jgi:hypothetical protein